MKEIIIVALLVNGMYGCKQKPKTTYSFKVTNEVSAITKQKIDSTINILNKRLVKEDYEDADIKYDATRQQFNIEVVSKGSDEFIKNGLTKRCEVFIYESFDKEIIFGLLSQNVSAQDDFTKYVEIEPASYNYRAAELGFIKRQDTAEFSKLAPSLAPDLPIGCVLLYGKTAEGKSKERISVYACNNNDRRIYVNTAVTDARQDFDVNGRPCIRFTFNAVGSSRFAKMTSDNVNRPLLIVVNGKVYSAPTVAGEISGGNAEISGVFTVDETREIANILRSGNLALDLSLKK